MVFRVVEVGHSPRAGMVAARETHSPIHDSPV